MKLLTTKQRRWLAWLLILGSLGSTLHVSICDCNDEATTCTMCQVSASPVDPSPVAKAGVWFRVVEFIVFEPTCHSAPVAQARAPPQARTSVG